MKVVCPWCSEINVFGMAIKGIKLVRGEILFNCDACGRRIALALSPTPDKSIEFEIEKDMGDYIG